MVVLSEHKKLRNDLRSGENEGKLNFSCVLGSNLLAFAFYCDYVKSFPLLVFLLSEIFKIGFQSVILFPASNNNPLRVSFLFLQVEQSPSKFF